MRADIAKIKEVIEQIHAQTEFHKVELTKFGQMTTDGRQVLVELWEAVRALQARAATTASTDAAQCRYAFVVERQS